jgi:aspartyl/glutamyl-tRNA(Asn/Gln) amidotransferase B subunit
MAEYEPVIGLEIHVHLQTRTKMFCGCELSFGDEPNVHTCPVCLAHPGVLPVPNEKAIRYALMIAAALGCEVAPRSIFHRKNYFYPDNPKAYQISQYDIPLATGGRLGEVRIHRVHLEEDAAKMIHVGESGRIHGSGASLVDFNRAGTPLVEIVTEPDLRSASEVRAWAHTNNVELAYTPFYASWLNRIEAQFQALRYFCIAGTDHPDHATQARLIRRYIAWRNDHIDNPRLLELVRRANTANVA